MFAELVTLYPMLGPFLLVLFRVMGLFAFVPVFSNAAIPTNVKALLGLAITLCIFPIVPRTQPPADLIGITLAIMGELSVGLLLGITTNLVFTGVQLGAHMLSQQMGLSMAAIYDPMFDEQSTAIEQLAFWLTFVAFLAIGGHREVINALVYSYQAVPMGTGIPAETLLETAMASVYAAFRTAVQIGVPALSAFFLATLGMGFVARTMPQINLMTTGIYMNLLIGFSMILWGLSSWAQTADSAWALWLKQMANLLG